jgi:hypothetical protein
MNWHKMWNWEGDTEGKEYPVHIKCTHCKIRILMLVKDTKIDNIFLINEDTGFPY